MDVSTTDGVQGLPRASGPDGAAKPADSRITGQGPDQGKSSLRPAAGPVTQATVLESAAFSALALALAANTWAQVEGAWGVIRRQLGDRQPEPDASAGRAARSVPGSSDPQPQDLVAPARQKASPSKRPYAKQPSTRPLTGISEIRTFFRTNEQPIYFFGPTAFNLLGIDRWVRNFQYIAYYDSWDGGHPRLFVPSPASRSSTTCCATPRCRPT